MLLRPVSSARMLFVLLLACVCAVAAPAERADHDEALTIVKIDPPNWYASLPKPMLLVRGTGLTGAEITLSDAALQVEKVSTSENGHWAQVWLSASPQQAETVRLRVKRGGREAVVPYRFEAPRKAGDGMAGFSAKDVMYMILTDRFADGDLQNDGPDARAAFASESAAAERAKEKGWHGGDLRGIEQHLEYLQTLGVTAVWPTPVYQNHGPEAYHGYHATDYYAVDEHYGSMQDLQSLATALHRRGMKLVLDTVPNHVGPFHPWVEDEPTPDWFHGTKAHHIEAEFDFDALINPHAAERDRVATLTGWFVNALPDMNTDNPVVAQYLRQNAVWWIEETGADGLRIDTFPYVDRPFWHAFTAELRELFPHVTEVGEVSNGDPEVTSSFADGVTRAGVDTGLYTPFDFPMYHAARAVFGRGESFTRIRRVLEADALYPHPERLVPFLGNHDETRMADAIKDPEEQKLAYAFLMTTRGMPQIYAGDEIAMQGRDDPDNRRDFPGGFEDGGGAARANAFRSSGRTPEQQAMFAWDVQMGELRRKHSALSCGAEQLLKTSKDVFVYARYGESGCPESPASGRAERLIVVLQRGAAGPIQMGLQGTAMAGCRPGQMISGTGTATVVGDQMTITPQSQFVVFGCK